MTETGGIRQRKRLIMAFGVLTVSGLVAGCGDDSAASDTYQVGASAVAPPPALSQKLGQPDMTPSLEPDSSPAADASLSESLAYELRRKTLKMAQAPGRTTASCPKDISGAKGSTTTCTTTYEGLTITWKVTVGDKAAWSDNYVTFESTPDHGLITESGVARLLYGNFRDSIDYVLCNDIPPVELAPLNQPSKYSCEAVFKGSQPTGKGTAVRATEAGPRVY